MTTQEYTIDAEIKLCAVKAASFPEGINGAHAELSDKVSATKVWGLSRPEKDGVISYYAANEVTDQNYISGCAPMTIAKGRYIGLELQNYRNNVQQIGAAFQLLTRSPGIDPDSYCVERYISEQNVICMVRLID